MGVISYTPTYNFFLIATLIRSLDPSGSQDLRSIIAGDFGAISVSQLQRDKDTAP